MRHEAEEAGAGGTDLVRAVGRVFGVWLQCPVAGSVLRLSGFTPAGGSTEAEMEFTAVEGLPEVILVKPDASSDEHGSRVELYHQAKYEEGGVAWRFAQAGLATAGRGVLRGLHYQFPHGQGTLLAVTRGEVWCVAVDVRSGSPTFGQWRGERLSAQNGLQMWLPSAFALGWLVLSEEADLVSQSTDMDDPGSRRVLAWDDPALGIEWPGVSGGAVPCVSREDSGGRTLEQLSAAGELPLYIE